MKVKKHSLGRAALKKRKKPGFSGYIQIWVWKCEGNSYQENEGRENIGKFNDHRHGVCEDTLKNLEVSRRVEN